jgi:hypothetical protein
MLKAYALLSVLAQRGGDTEVDVNLTLNGIVALAAGVLILVFPKILNYIVAAYLIFIGIVEIFDIRI